MYSVAKSLVYANDTKSEYFMCNIGVRQGENVSPLLFSIFLNDLEQYFIDTNVSGLEECTESMLQALDVFSLYFNEWKLSVNTSISKIVIFSKRKNY